MTDDYKQALYELRWYLFNKPTDVTGMFDVLDGVLGPVPNPPLDIAPRYESLDGAKIAIMPGHEPGGGAQGERDWNVEICNLMAPVLQDHGARVFNYRHQTASYSLRQRQMREAVKAAFHGPADVVLELHYDSVENQDAHGHDFFYLGFPELARSVAETWQARFPESMPRYADGSADGIHHRPRGNGAGFLRQAPGPALLLEPFFYSNPRERGFFIDKKEEVADCYIDGLALYLARL